MTNSEKILVAYDGSPHSRAALEWAVLLGSNGSAELEVVKVFEPILRHYTRGDYDIKEQIAKQYADMEQADRQMMEEVKAVCKEECKLNVHVDVLKGHVASTLLEYARKKGFGMIAAGTKGHGALEEMLVGSVTSSLVSLSDVPVLVVKGQKAPTALQKILVAYDGSAFAKAALDVAIDIGKSTAAAITVVKVNDPLDLLVICSMGESGSAERMRSKIAEMDEADVKLLNEAKSIARNKGMEITSTVLPGGGVAETILRYAAEINADIIVAGTLGHGWLGELLIGSVTRKLVSLSKIPVLVVKK